ncbi:hypothetical protein AHAS_Ahas12G0183700 [Arachis hypogaea]
MRLCDFCANSCDVQLDWIVNIAEKYKRKKCGILESENHFGTSLDNELLILLNILIASLV